MSKVHELSQSIILDPANTISSMTGLEELSIDAHEWRYDGPDGKTADGEVLTDDEDTNPYVHFFEELTPNGEPTENYVEYTCPFAVGDFFRLTNNRVAKVIKVSAERIDYQNYKEGLWVWVGTLEDVVGEQFPEHEREDVFTHGDKVASVGFIRDDGDFELLATFNNNGEYMSDEAFYALVTKTMSAMAEQGEMDDLIVLCVECANDIVELDE